MSAEVWALVHAERAALVQDLARVDDPAWATPSLCPGWSVHDVVAHLVDNARTTAPRLILGMLRARFDFDRLNQQGVERERGATPHETLERLRAVVGRTDHPPVHLDSRLVEEVVHGEDVRRPLGLVHPYAPEAVARSLAYQARTSVSAGGARQHVAGLRLEASDADVVVGEGEVVRGPALSLLLAVSGRSVGRADLEGPGLERLP